MTVTNVPIKEQMKLHQQDTCLAYDTNIPIEEQTKYYQQRYLHSSLNGCYTICTYRTQIKYSNRTIANTYEEANPLIQLVQISNIIQQQNRHDPTILAMYKTKKPWKLDIKYLALADSQTAMQPAPFWKPNKYIILTICKKYAYIKILYIQDNKRLLPKHNRPHAVPNIHLKTFQSNIENAKQIDASDWASPKCIIPEKNTEEPAG